MTGKVRIWKRLVTGKSPVCRLWLSGRFPTRQDENQRSNQQLRTQNIILTEKCSWDPICYPIKPGQNPFHSHREDVNTDGSSPEEQNILSNPNQNPAFGLNQLTPLHQPYPRLPATPLLSNEYNRMIKWNVLLLKNTTLAATITPMGQESGESGPWMLIFWPRNIRPLDHDLRLHLSTIS